MTGQYQSTQATLACLLNVVTCTPDELVGSGLFDTMHGFADIENTNVAEHRLERFERLSDRLATHESPSLMSLPFPLSS